MATVNIGKIKFNWKGAYAAGTAYVVDDVVESAGSSYVCILASTGNTPPNATYWELMADKGTDTSVATTQGDVIYHNGTALARLGAGTSGQVLQTGGTGANPSWIDSSGGLVGFAHAKRGGSASTINSTTFTDTGLSITYTPIDYANNKIMLLLTGAVRQDDANGSGCFIQVTASGNHSTTNVFSTQIGIGTDLSDGQNYHQMSMMFEDTNLVSNNAVTYTLFGKTDNATSDFRPQHDMMFTIFEIGV